MASGSGLGGWMKRVDDAVFALEQTMVASFLAAMTVMVFLDVVYRRLTAPETKVGAAIAAVASLDAERQAWVDRTVAPILYGVLGLLLLWMCFRTAEREREAPFFGQRHGALGLTLATGLALTAVGWMMLHTPSASVYTTLGVAGAIAATVHAVRRRSAGWPLRVGAAWLVAGVFAWVAFSAFPEGYSWSKEMSLMLLLWVGFVGASVCVHEGKHLRMEAAAKLVPEGVRKYVAALGMLSAAGFAAFMTLLGYRYVFDPVYGAMAIGGVFEQTQVPDWIATSAVPVAFGLTTVRFVAAAVSALLGGDYGAPAPAEGLDEAEALAKEDAAEAQS